MQELNGIRLVFLLLPPKLMKPIQILLFLLLVLLALSGFHLIVPNDFTILGFPVKVFYPEEFVLSKKTKAIKEKTKLNLQNLQFETERLIKSDSIIENEFSSNKTVDTNIGRPLPDLVFHIDSSSGIQYPAGDTSILFPFFAELDSLTYKKKLIRVLHFGDSQIEGDRVSGYIRQRLQQRFGGCGPGLLPFYEESRSRFSIEIKAKNPIDKYIIYGKPVPLGHRNYSVLHSIFRLSQDSLYNQQLTKNSLSFSLNSGGFKRANFYEKATIMLRNSKSKVVLSLNFDEKENIQKEINQNDSLRIIDFNTLTKKKKLNLFIESDLRNDFYGVCLDCNSGVAVDNIPLRGSSGLELLKINPTFLQEQIKRLGVRLVILQFGINVVPYEANSFSWYESSLTKVIQTIKKSRPGIQVLVVGVSDMAKRNNGFWESYESINSIRLAQKNAAERTNSAFWDLYEVMGGANSIQAWANSNPALAGKDYIHFTPKGAQIIGEFLFQALQKEKNKMNRNEKNI